MVKIAKTFKLTHVRGHFSHFAIVSDASELAKRHKYFGWHYAPSIQWWGFDPTDRISLQDLGGIKSPSFSVSYIKAHEHHFLFSSSQFKLFVSCSSLSFGLNELILDVGKPVSKGMTASAP